MLALGTSMGFVTAMHASSTADVIAPLRSDNALLVTGGPGLAW